MRCIAVALFLVLFSLVGFSNHQEPVVLRASHSLSTGHPAHKAIGFMATRLEQLSAGRITLKIYPNGILGTQRESIELLKTGAIDIAKSNGNEMEAFHPPYGALNMPYLFRDQAHYDRVTEGKTGRQILESSLGKGFLGLTFYDAGTRSFYGKKPVRTPADIRGQKLRVQPGQTAIKMTQLMGASPVPIDLGELYTAIQQGLVMGAENNVTTFVQSQHAEVARYFSSSHHSRIPDVLLISSKTWARLTPAQQRIVQQAASESAEEMKKLWAESEAEHIDIAKKMGVRFVETDRAAFARTVEPLYQLMKQRKPDVYAVVEQIRNQP